MTETEVEGRALDALVAEKVMGWRRCHIEANDQQFVTVPPDWADLSTARWWGHDVNELVPLYSTEIAAAWQVVSALNRRGLYVSVDSAQNGEGSVAVLAHRPSVSDDCMEMMTSVRSAETVPLAICRAALQACA